MHVRCKNNHFQKNLQMKGKKFYMINILNSSKAYSEVYEFINVLGNEYKNKIPDEIYQKIQSNRDTSYLPKYDINQQVNVNTFSKEAFALISILNLKYWCNDPEEISRLKSVYMQNEELEEEKISPNNIFKSETSINSSLSLVEYNKESWLEKLFDKIRNIFKKNIK